ncbi:(2Fe-2S)-binding protein [Carboxydothermus islandicus]|uniref:(2Fe-2S)-binding protein n=1 Tax=Carboxydothermus islandicus TaxID=661089 RepID=A0A1L8D3K6_9THEO|nr:(2Fe-2S)-binding protein [Carboxydothermus islandicus]GAV25684.1 (2Fe-2S)-binding protein [Carboxydothermus islandicus]
MISVRFKVNNEWVELLVHPHHRLIDILREELDLTGAKEGCGGGECGSCTVIMNGQPVNACLVLAPEVDGAEILTVEGLSKDEELDIVQEAFIDEGALQCGYCTPGMIMSAKALLMRNPNPTREEVIEAISGNLCRCTGYIRIVNAVLKAAQKARV